MLDRAIQPTVHNLEHLSLPTPRRLTLDNGIPMTVLDSGTQELNRLSVFTDGGIIEAPSADIARLAAATMLEGAQGMSGAEIADNLDYNGAWCKTSTNIHHRGVVVYSLNSRFDDVLSTTTRVIATPAFPDHEIAVIADKHAAQLSVAREKVTYWATLGLNRLTKGPTHPLAVESTPEQVKALTRDELSGWYNLTLNPGSMHVYLSGHITPAMEDAVNNTIGRMTAAGPGVAPDYMPFSPSPDHTPLVIDRPGALQSAVAVGIPSIPRSHPDYIPLRLAVIALGGYFGSRLMLNIREEKGLTYGIGASLAGGRSGSTVEIATECDNRYVTDVIREIRHEIDRLTDPATFTNDEIDRLRRHVMSTLASMLDSPFTMMDCFENILLSSTPDDYFDRQQLFAAQMSPEMIATMARRYLAGGDIYTVVAGDSRLLGDIAD